MSFVEGILENLLEYRGIVADEALVDGEHLGDWKFDLNEDDFDHGLRLTRSCQMYPS